MLIQTSVGLIGGGCVEVNKLHQVSVFRLTVCIKPDLKFITNINTKDIFAEAFTPSKSVLQEEQINDKKEEGKQTIRGNKELKSFNN